jgi:type IV pilus assembly protein PilY1
MRKTHRPFPIQRRGAILLGFVLTLVSGLSSAATTTLSDVPVGTASNVPANLMLALSVEYPTGTVAAYKDASGYTYSTTSPYLGYFDNAKCYDYITDASNSNAQYFAPIGSISSNGSCVDSKNKSHWSGSMLNWATMTALDEFRQSLTGGNRSIDTTSTTVLLRSNLNSQSSTGNMPDRHIYAKGNVLPSTVIGDATYSGLSDVYIRSAGQGSNFLISDNSGFSTGNIGTSSKPKNGNVTTYSVAVQACVTGMLETNCNSAHASTDYTNAGVYNKPDGLIQQNYTRIRVGAAGYVFASGDRAANGLVRALLRDNGPTTYNGNGARQTNTQSEWDAKTGIFAANPYPTDTAKTPGATTPTQTGAINYLNKFGYANGYETYDTLADLYWASLAYLMKVQLDAGYTSGMSASGTLDTNFPAFSGTDLNDPVQYTCQANAIVTIGDSHTWYDTRVPSSGGPTPNTSTRAALTPVNGADAAKYVTALGNLPLIEGASSPKTMASLFGSGTSLGSKFEPNGTSNATYNMAGLAYFAHTQDIRPDQAGKQTVDTYTVDVLEPGPYDGTSGKEIYNPAGFNTGGGAAGPNMYWLAAKYGGFNDVNGDGIPANFLTWHTNTSTEAGKDLRPDNYFPGNRPDLIQSGLSQIFKKVSTTAQSAAGPGVTLSRVLTNVPANASSAPYYSPVAGFPIYTVSYTPTVWTGDVTGYVASASIPGSVNPVTGSASWSAQTKLDALVKAQNTAKTTYGWDSGRRIMTYNGTKGVAFRYSSLSSSQQTAIGSANMVNYLRGDSSNESATYRTRTHVLGDVVHSEAVLVQNALSPKYSETTNPGYTAFATSVASRAPVVYAGANDGMLHAFAGDFSVPGSSNTYAGGGSELFAYVPSLTIGGPNSTPLIDGLPALGNLNGVSTNSYSHHFYVDETPQVADVDFNYTALVIPAVQSTAASANWHTLLVGGLGKGGKGIYALDITNVPPAIDASSSTATTEGTLATQKVLWEFTAADMGYSYGAPIIAKTRKYGWVVLVTSGYNNASGNGHLYVLNAQTGALLETLNTPTTVGSAGNPSGLTQATAYTRDVSDNTIEQVYAGDLLGNVWRFDLSGATSAAYPAPTLLAQLTDSANHPQPVTTAPRVELDLTSSGLGTRRWVFVGTGKALDGSDLTTTQQQTMYGLRDGDSVNPSTTGLPITRDTPTLHQITDLTKGAPVADTDAGWYYDLTGTAGQNGATERIVVNPDSAAGTYVISWATMTPTSDPCTLAGSIYSVAFGSGQSVLVDGSGNIMSAVTALSAPTKLEQVQLPGTNQISLLYGQAGQPPQVVGMRQGGNNGTLQRVNWREIIN